MGKLKSEIVKLKHKINEYKKNQNVELTDYDSLNLSIDNEIEKKTIELHEHDKLINELDINFQDEIKELRSYYENYIIPMKNFEIEETKNKYFNEKSQNDNMYAK